jgi:hypothetical protein
LSVEAVAVVRVVEVQRAQPGPLAVVQVAEQSLASLSRFHNSEQRKRSRSAWQVRVGQQSLLTALTAILALLAGSPL